MVQATRAALREQWPYEAPQNIAAANQWKNINKQVVANLANEEAAELYRKSKLPTKEELERREQAAIKRVVKQRKEVNEKIIDQHLDNYIAGQKAWEKRYRDQITVRQNHQDAIKADIQRNRDRRRALGAHASW